MMWQCGGDDFDNMFSRFTQYRVFRQWDKRKDRRNCYAPISRVAFINKCGHATKAGAEYSQ